MTDTRNDSYGGLLASVGAARQYGTQVVDLGGLMFGSRWAYSQGGLAARVVDMPADLATARGVTVQGAGPDLTAEMERLKLLPCMSDALRWSLLDGGGALIVMSVDSGLLAEPLEPAGLQRIEEFRVISLVDMRGSAEKYDDPEQLNFGQPIYYEVTLPGVDGQIRVHESRIIEVPGAPIATIAGLDMRNVPWAGRGLSPKAILAIQRYQRGVQWAEKLLERSQQAVHKMMGLAKMLMAGQESVVRARIDLVDSNRNSINGVAVDSEDDYQITSASLAGVKDTINELEVAVAAEVGWPVTILFGRSPGGLNSTGDSDWDLVFSDVNHLQTRRLGPAMERAVSLIYAQSAGEITERPDKWKIIWNPLKQQTAQQRADVENKEADTLGKLTKAIETVVNLGTLSQDDAQAFLAKERLFGLEPPDDGTGASDARRYAGQT